MAAEYEDLPEEVTAEVRAFADINVARLIQVLEDAQWGGYAFPRATGTCDLHGRRRRATYCANARGHSPIR